MECALKLVLKPFFDLNKSIGYRDCTIVERLFVQVVFVLSF